MPESDEVLDRSWTSIAEKEPVVGQNVIAVGTWRGEISGRGESEFMCIGEWLGSYVRIDAESYETAIVDVTHWMPIPEHPIA